MHCMLKSGLQHAWQLCRCSSNLIVATAIVKKFDCVCFLKITCSKFFGRECRSNGQYGGRRTVRIIQSVYQVDMSWSTATSATCQAIQLGLCTGCECSSFFVPYMDPFDFTVTVHSCIYVIETIACYCIDPLDTCIN